MTKHEDFEVILSPTVLKINLKLVWKYGIIDTETQDLSNENLRQGYNLNDKKCMATVTFGTYD